MKKILNLIAISTFLLIYSNASWGNHKGIFFPEQQEQIVTDWAQLYYLHPKPNKVVDMLDILESFGGLDDAYSNDNFMVLFAEIVKQCPEKISTYLKEVENHSLTQKSIIYRGIWEANLVDGQKELIAIKNKSQGATNKLITIIIQKPPQNILVLPLSPETLDKLWAAFFATGNEVYIKRIISTLNMIKVEKLAPPKTSTNQFKEAVFDLTLNIFGTIPNIASNKEKTQSAACWSLRVLAYSHPEILALYKKLLPTLTSREQIALTLIINEIKNEQEEDQVEENKMKANKDDAIKLANFYLSRKQIIKSISVLTKSSAEGFAPAQALLGTYYADGSYGLKRNTVKANQLLISAANQDNADAAAKLGLQYLNGNGIPSNAKKAFIYFKQAGSSHSYCGAYMTGKMYFIGKGTIQDPEKARLWIKFAVEEFNKQRSFFYPDEKTILPQAFAEFFMNKTTLAAENRNYYYLNNFFEATCN